MISFGGKESDSRERDRRGNVRRSRERSMIDSSRGDSIDASRQVGRATGNFFFFILNLTNLTIEIQNIDLKARRGDARTQGEDGVEKDLKIVEIISFAIDRLIRRSKGRTTYQQLFFSLFLSSRAIDASGLSITFRGHSVCIRKMRRKVLGDSYSTPRRFRILGENSYSSDVARLTFGLCQGEKENEKLLKMATIKKQ